MADSGKQVASAAAGTFKEAAQGFIKNIHVDKIPIDQVGMNPNPAEDIFPMVPICFGIGSLAYLAYNIYQKYKNEITEISRKGFNYSSADAEPVLEIIRGPGPIPEIKNELKVVLNKPANGFYIPSIAPFQLKIETFLRVAKIPFEMNFPAGTIVGDKTLPWVSVGDEGVTEPAECIPFLCRTFGVNLEKDALQSRISTSRLVGIMLDNHLSLAIGLWRWVYDKGDTLKKVFPVVDINEDLICRMGESMKRNAFYHGLGRLPEERIMESALVDLKDLSVALGKHQYFLGYTPGEVDCFAFALLAQMIWSLPNSPFELEIKKHQNLMDFVFRMRNEYFPDWEQVLHVRASPSETVNPSTSDIGSMLGISSTIIDENKATYVNGDDPETDVNGNVQIESNESQSQEDLPPLVDIVYEREKTDEEMKADGQVLQGRGPEEKNSNTIDDDSKSVERSNYPPVPVTNQSSFPTFQAPLSFNPENGQHLFQPQTQYYPESPDYAQWMSQFAHPPPPPTQEEFWNNYRQQMEYSRMSQLAPPLPPQVSDAFIQARLSRSSTPYANHQLYPADRRFPPQMIPQNAQSQVPKPSCCCSGPKPSCSSKQQPQTQNPQQK